MITIKKIRPMFTKIVTTACVYGEDQTSEDGVIVRAFAGTVIPYQRVVATGTSAGGIKEGDIVCVNPKRYSRSVYDENNSVRDDVVQTMKSTVTYNVPTLELDGVKHFLLEASDIDYVVEDYEGSWESLAKGGGSLASGIGSNLIV